MSRTEYLTGKLMTPLHFNSDDLALNRAGQLSEKQKQRWDNIARGQQQWNKWGTVVLVGFFGVTLGYPLLTDRTVWNNPYAVGGILAILALIGGGYIGVAILNGRRLRMAGREDVGQITGTVTGIQKQHSRFNTYWYVEMGREKIYMENQQAAEAFEVGATYTVYYLDFRPAKLPLSAEAVESFAEVIAGVNE